VGMTGVGFAVGNGIGVTVAGAVLSAAGEQAVKTNKPNRAKVINIFFIESLCFDLPRVAHHLDMSEVGGGVFDGMPDYPADGYFARAEHAFGFEIVEG